MKVATKRIDVHIGFILSCDAVLLEPTVFGRKALSLVWKRTHTTDIFAFLIAFCKQEKAAFSEVTTTLKLDVRVSR